MSQILLTFWEIIHNLGSSRTRLKATEMDRKALAVRKGRHFLPIVPISESYRAHFHCHLVEAHFAGSLWPMYRWPTFPSMVDPLDFARESGTRGYRFSLACFFLPRGGSYRISFLRLSSLPRVALCRRQCSRKVTGKSPSASFARATFVLDIHPAVSLFSTSLITMNFVWNDDRERKQRRRRCCSDYHYLHSVRARDSNLSGRLNKPQKIES